jgi:NitT/TauT family transport system substrate-binding protein
MFNRREWARVCASALLAGVWGPAWAQDGAAPAGPSLWRAPLGRVVLAVEQKTAFCYLPLTIAERLGFFVAEGLDVQMREFSEPGQAVQALASGAVQVASVPYSQLISLHMRGQALRSFVLQGRAPQLVLGVSRQSMAHFRQLRDLRGRRIAVTGLGSASHRVTRLLLQRAGLGPQDVHFHVFNGPLATASALRTGVVDALCYHDPLITQLEQNGDLRVVADTRTLRGSQEVFGGPMPAGCLGASEAFVVEQPRVCQALANAMVLALKWLQTAGPSDLNKTVPERYFQGDRALYLAAFSRSREAWVPDGLMPEAGPPTAARMLAQFDDAQQVQRVDLARTFTNTFARTAKQRFRA